ncbi:ketopantoate reductase family protein [Actinosynnema pretiosum]|uniref:ketopantoate reductase family protein n=1 Tax=Actinosynnema pretiosum TaxID=42197 RepID=UPI000AC98A92|nr:2-dehydropantoate 2-reductase N-terminal domain-containing protein [Actinosynnema pretiosum]
MKRTPVLIVGAGAVGTVLGHHLRLSGAEVTHLVRPGRAQAHAAPKLLYDYDEDETKVYQGYHVVERASELAGRDFPFVVITLDGRASRTEQGVATLTSLGDLVRGNDTVVIMCGVGLGLRRHYLDVLGVDEERLLFGVQGALAHQADPAFTAPPGGDAEAFARADYCYAHPKRGTGFSVTRHNPTEAERFASLYNNSAVSRCSYLNPQVADAFSGALFAIWAAWGLKGWPPLDEVIADKALWALACDAQREILALPANGRFGKLAAGVMGPKVTAAYHRAQERAVRPLDLAAFNAFHHGGKVREQDVAMLRDLAAEGAGAGLPTTALRELLGRLDGQGEPRELAAQG